MLSVPRRTAASGLAVTAAVAAVLVTAMVPASAAAPNKFTVKRIVTDSKGAPNVDKSLVNPWGMAQGPNTPVWVSDNGTDVSTLYQNGPNPKVPLTVKIPGGAPTGQVYNGSGGFSVTGNSASFIFDSEAGVLSGWNSGTTAVKERTVKGAIFKGLAMASVGGKARLYATDFHHNQVDMFDSAWKRISSSTAFVDKKLPAGYAPFGIASLNGKIYVSYAKQDAQQHDDVAGPGNGYVDIFTTAGALTKRLISRGGLDSPWGMTIAPANWGPFGGALLVGNFGDGRIHAYNATTGASEGALKTASGHPIVLQGLWGLLFGNGVSAATDALMFTSGPGGESHGRWGTITPS